MALAHVTLRRCRWKPGISFAVRNATAANRLKELCHITVSDDTIERVCQDEGQRAQKWMNESDAPVKSFAAATG